MLIDSLKIWCENNKIILPQINDIKFEIPNFGHCIILSPKKNKIIDRDCCFILSEKEWEHINDELKYFVFEFGNRWYYSEIKEFEGDTDELKYEANFNDFKFVGMCSDVVSDSRYCHLGIHSEYELLNGSGKSKDWIKKAKFLGVKTLGICDRNTLAGVLSFQNECKKEGMGYVIGRTTSVAYEYDESLDNQVIFDVKLYVKNEAGWKNLLKINNYSNILYEGKFITEELLFEHSDGLILVFGKFGLLEDKANNSKEFVNNVLKYKKHFKDIFIQIDFTEYDDPKHDIRNLEYIKTYLNKYRSIIKPVLIQDTYYIDVEHVSLKESLNKIEKKAEKYSEDEYFKSLTDVINTTKPLFKDRGDEFMNSFFDEMLTNTQLLVSKCSYTVTVGIPRLPKYEFKPKKYKDNVEFFHSLLEQGFNNKVSGLVDDEQMYRERLNTETELMIEAGIVDYFLILWDVINWCSKKDIMVGTGRGSAAGSLVCYLLNITNVDPIKYNLLFERFLNKTRIMPIQYVILKLQDGSTKRYQYGTKVKTKRGLVLVEELTEEDDIDLD